MAPAVAIWLLLPIGPAALLRLVARDGEASCVARVIRVFSVATLAAVAVQAVASALSIVTAAVVVALTILFLTALERAVVEPQRLSWDARRAVVD